jgi:hypothetical protein
MAALVYKELNKWVYYTVNYMILTKEKHMKQ